MHVGASRLRADVCAAADSFPDLSLFVGVHILRSVCSACDSASARHMTDGGPPVKTQREERSRGLMCFKLKSDSRICSKCSAEPLCCQSADP